MNGKIFIPWRRCRQSKRQLRCSLFSSLCFLARPGSVMLFLQPHLSEGVFFPSPPPPPLFLRFQLFRGILRHLKAAGAGGSPRFERRRWDPSPRTLGHPQGVKPHLLPKPFLPFPGIPARPRGLGAAFASALCLWAGGFWGPRGSGVSRGCFAVRWEPSSFILFRQKQGRVGKTP